MNDESIKSFCLHLYHVVKDRVVFLQSVIPHSQSVIHQSILLRSFMTRDVRTLCLNCSVLMSVIRLLL